MVQATLFPLAFAGGLFLPPEAFPAWLDALSQAAAVAGGPRPGRAGGDRRTPAYARARCWCCSAWTVLFAALAVTAYRRDEGRRFH